MNLVRCLSLGTNRAGVLLTTRSPQCVRPQKPGQSWIIERCLSYSSIRLNEQSATGSTKFADAVNQTVLPDKELIDLTSINADPLNTAEQVIQSASTLNQVISATDIGLSAYFPPRLFYDFITTLHDSTGWAWVPSIAAACVVMRFCTFPLYVNSRKESTKFTEKMMNMQKEIIGFQPTGSLEQQLLARQEKAMSSMMEVQRSMPKFLMSPIASAVVFSSFYFCLRAMASHPLASMKAESFLWVPSLTAADPYFLFPALTASTLFLVLHYNMEAGECIFSMRFPCDSLCDSPFCFLGCQFNSGRSTLVSFSFCPAFAISYSSSLLISYNSLFLSFA